MINKPTIIPHDNPQVAVSAERAKERKQEKTPRLFERKGPVIIMDRRDPNAFDGTCAFCGKKDELRPYGPNNESICFDCAMKDEATTAKKFGEMIDNVD